jgi:predicted nucleotidyltransferase
MNPNIETCIALEPRHYEHLVDVIQRSMTGFHGRVFLFGSRARGNPRPTSDIDLAVSLDNAGATLSRLRENIENSHLPFTADVVDLASCGSALAEEVQREGVLLWNG